MPTAPSLADRVELRTLVETYASAVDRRRWDELGALFGEAGRLYVYKDEGQSEPSGVRTGAVEIAAVVSAGIGVYRATSHMVGAHSIEMTDDPDVALGSTTCRAYHVRGAASLMIMAIMYEDRYVRSADGWRFDERHVRLQWRETRTLVQ